MNPKAIKPNKGTDNESMVCSMLVVSY